MLSLFPSIRMPACVLGSRLFAPPVAVASKQVIPAWEWQFPCHRAVLCSSPWWCALLTGGFREGGGDTIDMSGLLHEGVTSPRALEAAIR